MAMKYSMKKAPALSRDFDPGEVCRNGHDRMENGYRSKQGWKKCHLCDDLTMEVHRRKRGATVKPENTVDRAYSLLHIRLSTGCWEWTGSITSDNYGMYTVKGGRNQMVHRLFYTLHIGPIADGYEVDHLCRNTICCNPWHLEAVTPEENHRRSNHPGKRTHCIHGHEFTPENIYLRPEGGRGCRECTRKALRKSKKRRWRGLHPEFSANQYKTHCDNGHEFTPGNTYTWKGHRRCKRCNADKALIYRQRRDTKTSPGKTVNTREKAISMIHIRVDTGCWEWIGSLDEWGYGLFKLDGEGKTHRMTYRWLIGSIDKGFVLDHLCCNTKCCNPWHLEPVTPSENSIRRRKREKISTSTRAEHTPR